MDVLVEVEVVEDEVELLVLVEDEVEEVVDEVEVEVEVDVLELLVELQVKLVILNCIPSNSAIVLFKHIRL